MDQPIEPTKAPSEWQYVRYTCPRCQHTGECKVRPGEYPFCGARTGWAGC